MISDPAPGAYGPETRLPAGTRPGRVRLQVADLGRSVAYYETVLGLAVRERAGDAATLGSGARGAAAGDAAERGDEVLLELRERPGAAPMPAQGRLGLYHFALLLPDRAVLGRFVRHLGDLDLRPGASDHLVSEALYLRDPDGLGIEVYADRPRSEWRRRKGELVMATGPLDLADVARAGGERPWDGLPRGTTIGHIHLHVGQLDRAAEFYERALGFDRTVWSYPGALFLAAGGYHHHLGVNTWAASAHPAGEDDARLLEWELLVPSEADLAHAARRLTASGFVVDGAAADAADGPGVVSRDPWGTALRIRTDAGNRT